MPPHSRNQRFFVTKGPVLGAANGRGMRQRLENLEQAFVRVTEFRVGTLEPGDVGGTGEQHVLTTELCALGRIENVDYLAASSTESRLNIAHTAILPHLLDDTFAVVLIDPDVEVQDRPSNTFLAR